MENLEQKYSSRNLIVVAVIAEFFSSFTIWLVESPIKYPLFIIETLSIVMIYVILSNNDFGFALKKDITKRISPALLLDVLLIYFASILIIMNQFNITESTISLILAFVCTTGLSGFALLNVCRLTKYFSKLETLVLSFLTSFILSGFCTLIFLWTDESTRSVIIPSVFVALGIASLLRHLKIRGSSAIKINSFSKNIDILAIVLCIAFYAVFFYYVYPNFTLIANSDTVRHYQNSLVLSRTPDLYITFNYFLFHAFGAAFNILSGSPNLTPFITIQVILNFILPISVYIFAKRFLADLDRRIPAIAMVFYTISSNFSFIYFTYLKISGTKDTEFHLLANTVAEKTYNGTVYSAQPFLSFEPTTVVFIMFIAAFILLKAQSLPRSKFIPLYTTLILGMYLTHVPEAVMFVSILGIYSMISKSKSLRLDDALLSSLIAFALSAIILVYTSVFWTSILRNPGIVRSSMLPVIASILVVGISILWRRKILYKISMPVKFINRIKFISSKKFIIRIKFISRKKFYQILSVVLVAIYILGLFTWFFDNDFKTSLVSGQGSVPWFVYPLSFGIVGILALLAIRHMGYILPNSSVAVLWGSITILFVFGKVLSLVNLHFFNTGYFEKRFLPFIFLFFCLLAPIPLIKLMDQISVKRKFFTIGFSVIISIIVLLGFSSMILQSEFWSYVTQTNIIAPGDYLATNYLKNILQHDSRAFLISPTAYSNTLLARTATPYQLSQPQVVFSSKNPEIPLYGLGAHDLPHAYIYMRTQDRSTFIGKDSWLINHLLPTLPVIFSNNGITIYNATHVSYPRPNSDMTMIIPSDPNVPNDSFFYAYDVISKHDRNYTVMFDRDQNALASKTVVLSYDPPENANFDDLHGNPSLQNWKIISGIWKYSSSGLHGGSTNQPRGIILTPTSSKNFTLDTSFRILDADPNGSSYISIISSWNDPKNLELTELAFIRHHVYVSYITVRDGYTYPDSTWPGKATKLSWALGDLFNITFSKQGNLQVLLLNGTKYLHQGYTGRSGFIGLEYTRINDLVFDHVDIRKLDELNLRDPMDYISYAKSGGNLIVLNTNGHHSISDILFNTTNPTYESSKIVMPSGDSLPVNAAVLPISAGKNVTPLAFYNSSENNSSIFVVNKTVGLGKITYVNIFPIISSFKENKISTTTFQKILEEISGIIGGQPINQVSQKNPYQGNFEQITVYGNATVKTTSLVFPGDQLKKIIIRNNDKEISIANATNLNINGYHNAILQENYTALANGKGFYGDLDLSNSVKIFFEKNATLGAITDNNKPLNFDNVSNIFIQNNNPIHVYAWQPEINASGYISLKNLWGAPCLTTTAYSGQNFGLSGNLSQTIFMSDAATYFSCMESHKNPER